MTDLSVPDSPKAIREALCAAQSALSSTCVIPYRPIRERTRLYIEVLQRLADECDRRRPLGPDGVHGDRHTPTCGCEDASIDALHADQGCGYRWNDMIGFLNPGPSRRHLCAKEVHTLNSEHECRCGDTRPNVDPLLDMDPHAHQTCGFRWEAANNRTSPHHQCRKPLHKNGILSVGEHECGCGETRPGVVVTGAQIGRED